MAPFELLQAFAEAAKKSRAPDGSLQEDGWGIAWLDHENRWQRYNSLLPIWDEKHRYPDFPRTKTFAVHARSASFADQKDVPEYNQPYVDGAYAFVFNGFLKGVALDLPGKIGAQRVWVLLRSLLQKNSPRTALEKTKEILLKNSREVQALNIGLADAGSIDALCFYTSHPDYYQLHTTEMNGLRLISSCRL